jgi:hypothetical protein
MNHHRLTSTAAALAATLLLATGSGLAVASSAPQGHARTTTPCLVVADRVQDWIDLHLDLPHCVRALQRAAAR